MDNFIIAVILLFALVFLARTINEKALKNLDADKKVALIELFSRQRTYTIAVLFTIIIAYFLNIKFEVVSFETASLLYFSLLFLYIIIKSFFSYSKLKKNDFPPNYIKSFLLSTIISSAGFLVFFAILFLKY